MKKNVRTAESCSSYVFPGLYWAISQHNINSIHLVLEVLKLWVGRDAGKCRLASLGLSVMQADMRVVVLCIGFSDNV
jgi:hypothetical protein